MKLTFEQASHYIDRQFGGVIYISTDSKGIVTGIDTDGTEYNNGKLQDKLKGLHIDEADEFLNIIFRKNGVYMKIKPLH